MAKKDIKENFFTESAYEYPGVEEPWRCDGCGKFIYNLCLENGHWYPTSGAPLPRYVDSTYKKVCSLCLAMHDTVNANTYFRTLSEKAVEAKKVKQKEWEGMG